MGVPRQLFILWICEEDALTIIGHPGVGQSGMLRRAKFALSIQGNDFTLFQRFFRLQKKLARFPYVLHRLALEDVASTFRHTVAFINGSRMAMIAKERPVLFLLVDDFDFHLAEIGHRDEHVPPMGTETFADTFKGMPLAEKVMTAIEPSPNVYVTAMSQSDFSPRVGVIVIG